MSDMARVEPSLSTGPLFSAGSTTDGRPDPMVRIARAETYLDLTTIIAFVLSFAMIAIAIIIGNSKASFIDPASVFMVIGGTLVVTAISYTSRELRIALPVIRGSALRQVYDTQTVARELLDLAVLARKRGILSLSVHATELEKHPFLYTATQMVTDGLSAHEIDRLINQDIDITMDGYRKAAGMLRRASEIAPSMGLIGTLVGLMQMLVALDNPSSIGPAMALALLTTFYGAIMGSVVFAPLAAKLERNANEDVLIKTLIHAGMLAIISQENPRKLEMELNSLLPPDLRIRYFDL